MTAAHRRIRERQERRQAILDAAQAVFDEHGLAAATMEHVANRAELSKGTLYLYFGSKDELFMALAGEVLEQVRERLEPIANDSSLSGLAAFRRLAETYTATVRERPNTLRNAIIWFASAGALDMDSSGFRAYGARMEALQDLIGTVLIRGQDDHSIRDDIDPATTIAQVWPSLMCAVVNYCSIDEVENRLQKKIDRERLVPGLIDLIVRGIAASGGER